MVVQSPPVPPPSKRKVTRVFKTGDPIFSIVTAAVDKRRMIETFGDEYATSKGIGYFLEKTGNRTYCVRWTNLKSPYKEEYGVNHSIFDDPEDPRPGKLVNIETSKYSWDCRISRLWCTKSCSSLWI